MNEQVGKDLDIEEGKITNITELPECKVSPQVSFYQRSMAGP